MSITADKAMMNAKFHLKEYLENMSQTLFFRDALFGAALLMIAIAFKPQLFLPGLLASLVGYAYSANYRTPKILKQTGLLTINGFFFGIAMASLFAKSVPFYICLVVGAMALPLVTKAAFEVLQHWKLTPLIIPYILAVWVLYLCSNGIALQAEPKPWTMEDSFLPTLFPMADVWLQMIWSMFHSIGQIFFFHNSEFGIALLLLVTIFSPRKGLYFFLGSALATVVFHFISNGVSSWHYGFFSYSAGLVGLGLASLPEKFSAKTILLFCVVSLFLTLALGQLLKNLSLPLLSLPYVMTFWFAMLSRVPRLNVAWSRPEAA